MYLPEWVQKFKEPRTEIKKVGDHFYKYQVEYRHNKEKKRTDKITIGLLGKLTQNDGFVPSDKHLLKEKAKHSVAPTNGIQQKQLKNKDLFKKLKIDYLNERS